MNLLCPFAFAIKILACQGKSAVRGWGAQLGNHPYLFKMPELLGTRQTGKKSYKQGVLSDGPFSSLFFKKFSKGFKMQKGTRKPSNGWAKPASERPVVTVSGARKHSAPELTGGGGQVAGSPTNLLHFAQHG